MLPELLEEVSRVVVIDHHLGTGLGPRIRRPQDEVDIDIADDCKRSHHSLRVILVERTGVPALSTRSFANAIISRCAAGNMAKIAANPVAGLKGIVTAPAMASWPEAKPAPTITQSIPLCISHGWQIALPPP